MLEKLRAWLKSRQPKSLSELLIVEFDDETVSVRVLADLEPGWNQNFRFADIKRVCFEDGGVFSSDVVYVSLTDREKAAVIPTEAGGGHELFGALCDRGYFPEPVWRRAVGDTSGGLHCWPEE
jgi:hypothetical protein